jgi:hypothetical protein
VQPILKDDIWPIIQNRVGSIDHFRPRDPYHYARFHECAPLKVTLQQLLITREERDRFEDAHKIEVVEPDVRLRRECFTHDADYAHVDLLGRSFTLGATQARIVRALHEASLAGSPWVRQDELLERCGAKSSRLVDVFKAKQDWRQLITHDGRGRWRLNLPERGPSKARQQAFRRAVKSKVIVLQRDL